MPHDLGRIALPWGARGILENEWWLLFGWNSRQIADATIPNEDIEGAADSTILKRYEGSFIVSYEHEEFTDLKVPLSALDGRAKNRRVELVKLN